MVHEGHVIDVAGRHLRGARRHARFERDVVHHPGAVAVVAVDDDGTVVLVRQYRAAARPARCSRSRPASSTSTARSRSARAQRELVEEVGLGAGRLELLVAFHHSPASATSSVASTSPAAYRACADDRQGVEEQT